MARSAYDEIVDNALAAVEARLVVLTSFDPETHRVWVTAVSYLRAEFIDRALSAIRALVPRWDPLEVSTSADVNRWNRAIYLEGQTLALPFLDLAEGTVDARIVQIASAVVGLKHTFIGPLRGEGKIVGSLGFYRAEPFTEPQRRTGEAFIRQASLTIENAQLLAALHERMDDLRWSRHRIIAGQERLRREIAELLHGRVQTKLLVAWHRLGECERLCATDPAQAQALLAEIRAEIDRIREHDVREASHLLHPTIIRVGLVPAIRSLVERFEGSFRVTLRVDPDVTKLDDPARNRLPEPMRLAVYRILEEALANTYRHAAANEVAIELALDADGALVLIARDDGRGFDPAKPPSGLGLTSSAGHVDQFGGAWNITSALGQGTTVSVRIPLDRPEPETAPTVDAASSRDWTAELVGSLLRLRRGGGAENQP
ncbi:MAG: hypothetical protein HY329_26540 [Chloroflexi bacterium]|nr:hypothetical protein [Chloroflexota bacterium]